MYDFVYRARIDCARNDGNILAAELEIHLMPGEAKARSVPEGGSRGNPYGFGHHRKKKTQDR